MSSDTEVGVPPGHCLALEDSHNGVRSAFSAGVPVIMVPDMLEPTDESREKAAMIAGDLGEVAALLLGANGIRALRK